MVEYCKMVGWRCFLTSPPLFFNKFMSKTQKYLFFIILTYFLIDILFSCTIENKFIRLERKIQNLEIQVNQCLLDKYPGFYDTKN